MDIFINCPFDEEYKVLLRPILFSLVRLGFNPRIASERLDSGEVRLDKIEQLISECNLSIHDLSRHRAENEGDTFRMNMPFELGLDYGAKKFNPGEHGDKRFLIFEEIPHSVKRALSDLSFSDCKCHNGDPEDAVRALRNWIVESDFSPVETATNIWDEYNFFWANLEGDKNYSELDILSMPIPEFLTLTRDWHREIGFEIPERD